MIFHQFLLAQKGLNILVNDSDCKDVPRSIQYKKEICSNRKFGSYEKCILASKLFL
jgi:hypothetical protein